MESPPSLGLAPEQPLGTLLDPQVLPSSEHPRIAVAGREEEVVLPESKRLCVESANGNDVEVDGSGPHVLSPTTEASEQSVEDAGNTTTESSGIADSPSVVTGPSFISQSVFPPSLPFAHHGSSFLPDEDVLLITETIGPDFDGGVLRSVIELSPGETTLNPSTMSTLSSPNHESRLALDEFFAQIAPVVEGNGASITPESLQTAPAVGHEDVQNCKETSGRCPKRTSRGSLTLTSKSDARRERTPGTKWAKKDAGPLVTSASSVRKAKDNIDSRGSSRGKEEAAVAPKSRKERPKGQNSNAGVDASGDDVYIKDLSSQDLRVKVAFVLASLRLASKQRTSIRVSPPKSPSPWFASAEHMITHMQARNTENAVLNRMKETSVAVKVHMMTSESGHNKRFVDMLRQQMQSDDDRGLRTFGKGLAFHILASNPSTRLETIRLGSRLLASTSALVEGMNIAARDSLAVGMMDKLTDFSQEGLFESRTRVVDNMLWFIRCLQVIVGTSSSPSPPSTRAHRASSSSSLIARSTSDRVGGSSGHGYRQAILAFVDHSQLRATQGGDKLDLIHLKLLDMLS